MNKGIKILVTGAKGFIGKNLLAELRNKEYTNIFEVDIDTSKELLNIYAKECEFVFHLAGVNRPKDEKEFILIFNYAKEMDTKAIVYRLPNVFGKWSRPNYNTVVATYCHNIARDIEIQVNAPDAQLSLVYVDDVVEEFINALEDKGNLTNKFYEIPTVHFIKLGELAE